MAVECFAPSWTRPRPLIVSSTQASSPSWLIVAHPNASLTYSSHGMMAYNAEFVGTDSLGRGLPSLLVWDRVGFFPPTYITSMLMNLSHYLSPVVLVATSLTSLQPPFFTQMISASLRHLPKASRNYWTRAVTSVQSGTSVWIVERPKTCFLGNHSLSTLNPRLRGRRFPRF